MKLVRGIVRDDMVSSIVEALEQAGTSGVTVSNVKGRGTRGTTGLYRGCQYPVMLQMSAIEVIACDNAADDIARVMVDTAHTGHRGDGHVLVIPLDDCYAVRTRWREQA